MAHRLRVKSYSSHSAFSIKRVGRRDCAVHTYMYSIDAVVVRGSEKRLTDPVLYFIQSSAPQCGYSKLCSVLGIVCPWANSTESLTLSLHRTTVPFDFGALAASPADLDGTVGATNIEDVFAGAKTWSFISAKAGLLPDIYGTGVEPFATTAASTLQ
jgi:hypothetical protein